MRSVEELVNAARYRTGNAKYTYDSASGSTTSGLATSLFLEYLNDAQDSIFSRILKLNPSLFQAEKTSSIVANQEAYTLDGRLAFGTKIISVQYSQSGNTRDYQPLDRFSVYDRRGYIGVPVGYYQRAGALYLSPIPASSVGTIRTLFYARPDRLDISRTTVSGTPSGTTITTAVSPDSYTLANSLYICISDKFGNVMLRNGVVSSFAATTLTLTANVSTYLETGYTLADLANGYITSGKNTTRFSTLPDECERYLKTYMQKRVMTTNENSASIEEDQELASIGNDILANLAEEARDTEPFPITDPDAYY